MHMNNNLIIQLLREREAILLSDLQHIQSVIHDLLKEHSEGLFRNENNLNAVINLIPTTYDDCKTYNDKILFILCSSSSPLFVNDIVKEIIRVEPKLDEKKLHNTISYSLSMLIRSKRIKKYAFNKKHKYSIY
jgi:hypothetical protein